MRPRLCLIVFLATAILPMLAMASPSVNLTSPGDNSLSNQSNVTFTCNASSVNNISGISFYIGPTGNLSLNSVKGFTGITQDENTTLLCHFDGNYSCFGGNGINDSTSFESGKSLQGVLVNDTDTLKFQTYGLLNHQRGAIEFWVKPEVDINSYTFYLLDTGGNENRISMQISYGALYSSFVDISGTYVDIITDVSTWSVGEWHFIALVWDQNGIDGGDRLAVYTDSFSDYGDNPSFDQMSQFSTYFFIGSDASGNLQSYSVFDDIKISNTTRNDIEILSDWTIGSADHTNVSANFTIDNLSDGIYSWNCLAEDNESSAWALGNYTLLQDVSTPPNLNNILFSPNESDEIDPGTTMNITANITSMANISSVIFQYKYDVDWINLTMTNTSKDIWNASLITNNSERIYYYRIFANDSQGHENTSAEQSLNVTWDYTWTANISNSTAHGYINTIGFVAILYINNTGDDTLAITLADNWPIIDVYYNTTSQFSIPAKTLKEINITAMFAGFDSSNSMTINISAQPTAPFKTASPFSRNISVLMNTYSGGPFVDIIADIMPSQVNQSQSGINMSITLRNIGNETANNLSMLWSLPAGWAITSGNLTELFGDMPPMATNSSNITVSIDSSALSGMAQICVNANRSNGTGYVNYSECYGILVDCFSGDGACGNGCSYANDNECSIPSTGGGGGSMMAADYTTTRQKYGIVLNTYPVIHAFRNQTIKIEVDAFAKENKTVVNNAMLSLGGYPLNKLKISPYSIDNISYVNGGKFTIELSIPEYMKYGKYNLTLIASGKARSTSYIESEVSVNSSSLLVLYVHSISENSTIQSVHAAMEAVAKMNESGMNIASLSVFISSAENALENFDYETAQELADETLKISGMANSTHNILNELEQKLKLSSSYGISANQSQRLYSLSVAAFSRGDYERASERATGALLAYGIEVGDKIEAAEFIKNNYISISIAIIFGIIILMLASSQITKAKRARKLNMLESEELIIKTLIRSIQNRFFRNNTMGRGEFESLKESYEKRYSELRKEISRLQFPNNTLKNREMQLKRLNEMMKDVQKDYFERKTIGKNLYEKLSAELRGEIANIKVSIREKKKFIPFILCAIILLQGISFAASLNESGYDQLHAMTALAEAQKSMENARSMGFGITRMNDTLSEARIEMSRGNYVNAISLSLMIKNLEQSAIFSDYLIDQAEERLQDCDARGINTAIAWDYFQKGLDSFNLEIYEDSEKYFEDSLNALDEAENKILVEETSRNAQSGSMFLFIMQNQLAIAVFISILIIASVAVYILSSSVRETRKRAKLIDEKRSLESSIKSAQRHYFTLRSISKSEYSSAIKNHRKRIAEIDKELLLMDSIISRSWMKN